jgi:hypothetical protein
MTGNNGGELMFYIIAIIAAIFAVPANALDGTSSPANVAPPIGVVPTRNMPDSEYWHNPNLLEEFQRLAQATLGATVDPLIGTWKMNPGKSTVVGLPMMKSQTLTWSGEGQNLIDTADGVDSQGQAFKVVYRHIYDGQPHPTTGDPGYDASTYTRIGNTINIVRSNRGKQWWLVRQ